MGAFDIVKSEYPIEGLTEFYTKDLGCTMKTYTLRRDGTLLTTDFEVRWIPDTSDNTPAPFIKGYKEATVGEYRRLLDVHRDIRIYVVQPHYHIEVIASFDHGKLRKLFKIYEWSRERDGDRKGGSWQSGKRELA